MRKFKYITAILLAVFIFTAKADDREQSIGEPKEGNSITIILKGTVRDEVSNQVVPNADVTITEALQQKVITQTKADANGNYQVVIPKGINLELKAQAPQFFYDAHLLNVGMKETRAEIIQDFLLPSELKLRLNFPKGDYENPYTYVLDDNGNESEQTWQDAIQLVADDIVKYKEYISLVSIVGHTDDDGSETANVKLGEKRAEFLQNELQKRGVPIKMMQVRSAGESELLEKRADEDANDWKKRCRRVVMSKVMK